MREVELGLVRLGVVDEFPQIVHRKGLARHQHDRLVDDQADRLEVQVRLVCEVRIERDRAAWVPMWPRAIV